MAIYMQAPFAKGAVTASGYVGWIELEEIHLQVDRNISMEMGSMHNLPKEQPRFSYFTITKKIEDSSGGLFDEALKGMSGHHIEIVIVEPGDQPKEFARYILDDVHLASFTVSATADYPMEKIDLSFSRIEAQYKPHDRANTGAGKINAVYDLKA